MDELNDPSLQTHKRKLLFRPPSTVKMLSEYFQIQFSRERHEKTPVTIVTTPSLRQLDSLIYLLGSQGVDDSHFFFLGKMWREKPAKIFRYGNEGDENDNDFAVSQYDYYTPRQIEVSLDPIGIKMFLDYSSSHICRIRPCNPNNPSGLSVASVEGCNTATSPSSGDTQREGAQSTQSTESLTFPLDTKTLQGFFNDPIYLDIMNQTEGRNLKNHDTGDMGNTDSVDSIGRLRERIESLGLRELTECVYLQRIKAQDAMDKCFKFTSNKLADHDDPAAQRRICFSLLACLLNIGAHNDDNLNDTGGDNDNDNSLFPMWHPVEHSYMGTWHAATSKREEMANRDRATIPELYSLVSKARKACWYQVVMRRNSAPRVIKGRQYRVKPLFYEGLVVVPDDAAREMTVLFTHDHL